MRNRVKLKNQKKYFHFNLNLIYNHLIQTCIYLFRFNSILVITNSPDFLSKIFAKHYLTVLRIASYTVNRNNKHSNTSNALLGTSVLNVKSWLFYNNYGCNTKKMFFPRGHTKNMDLSNFTIGAHCRMLPDLILYFIATWPPPNIFS